jgi:hypothetical protein
MVLSSSTTMTSYSRNSAAVIKPAGCDRDAGCAERQQHWPALGPRPGSALAHFGRLTESAPCEPLGALDHEDRRLYDKSPLLGGSKK